MHYGMTGAANIPTTRPSTLLHPPPPPRPAHDTKILMVYFVFFLMHYHGWKYACRNINSSEVALIPWPRAHHHPPPHPFTPIKETTCEFVASEHYHRSKAILSWMTNHCKHRSTIFCLTRRDVTSGPLASRWYLWLRDDRILCSYH